MRGKVVRLFDNRKGFGITPAYAGKRMTCWEMCGRYQDHPRLCGEKAKRRKDQQPRKGSPPPMRGKAVLAVGDTDITRITPAYAGKSSDYTAGKCWFWDHPRLCGEKVTKLVVFPINVGSPPPMRGKVQIIQRGNVGFGITPAYAGKSL